MSEASARTGPAVASPFLQGHFRSMREQLDTAKLGLWLFLASELLFFGGLFVTYAVFRANHPDAFFYAHHFLDWRLGALNTSVLIGSSLTAAWAVRSAQLGRRAELRLMLLATLLLAGAFLVVKYLEYSHKVHEHILFGRYFDPCVSPGGNGGCSTRNRGSEAA